MSVTDAFRLLNSTLRNVREDERRHEERMSDIEVRKLQAEQEQTLMAQKLDEAREAMRPVRPDPIYNPVGKSTEQIAKFNDKSLPVAQEIANGYNVEIDPETYQYKVRGTDGNYGATLPKWKEEQLQADIKMGLAAANLESESLDGRISELDFKIDNATHRQHKLRGDRARVSEKRLADWKRQRDELISLRDDPSRRRERLMGDNLRLLKAEQQAHKSPEINEKLIEYLQRRIKNNNDLIKLDEAMTGEPNGVDVVYHRKENGRYIKTKMRFPSEDMAPPSVNREKQVWIRGDVGPKDDSGDGSSDKKRLSNSETRGIRKEYLKQRVILDAAKVDADQEDAIMDMLKDAGNTQEESEFILSQLKTAKRDIIERTKEFLKNYEEDYPEILRHQMPKDQDKKTDKERIKSNKKTKTEETQTSDNYDPFDLLD